MQESFKNLIILVQPLKNMTSGVLIAIVTGLISALGSIIGIFFSNKSKFKQLDKQISANKEDIDRKFKLNKNWQDSRQFLPGILNLSTNLKDFYYFLLYKGTFWPSTEAIRPTIDSDGKEGTISPAERGLSFLKIGLKIIEEVKTIIYLFPNERLPRLRKLCCDILDYLDNAQKGKRHLEILHQNIIEDLAEKNKSKETQDKNDLKALKKTLNDAQTIFDDFYHHLNEIMREEFPSLNSDS